MSQAERTIVNRLNDLSISFDEAKAKFNDIKSQEDKIKFVEQIAGKRFLNEGITLLSL